MTTIHTTPTPVGSTQQHTVDFSVDPSCPWTWRVALWMPEVEQVRPLQGTWRLLSLAKINEAGDDTHDSHTASYATFPLLVRAGECCGNEAIGRVSLALGRACHERQASLADPAVLAQALAEAGLDPAWRADAATEPGLEDRILAAYQDGIERVGAFGVPTIAIHGRRGCFGPVMAAVPRGEDAGEL